MKKDKSVVAVFRVSKSVMNFKLKRELTGGGLCHNIIAVKIS